MTPFRVLMVHNHYQQHGGEDESVASEIRILREAGHTVELLEASNAASDLQEIC